MTVIIEVEGTPAPQGSKSPTRYGFRESSKRVKPWRDRVKQAAAIRADELSLLAPLTPPYKVDMWFYIQRPRTTRAAYPVAPSVGDLDKLVRAVGDALTQSGLIEDDRHVIEIHTTKQWAGGGEKPGVVVRVTELGNTHTPTHAPGDEA